MTLKSPRLRASAAKRYGIKGKKVKKPTHHESEIIMQADKGKLTSSESRLIVFEDEHIRRVFHKSEWYFSMIDIIGILAQSSNPRGYWSDLKIQLSENEGFIQLYEKIVQLKLESSDGKKYLNRYSLARRTRSEVPYGARTEAPVLFEIPITAG